MSKLRVGVIGLHQARQLLVTLGFSGLRRKLMRDGMARRYGLGRGLEALIPGTVPPQPQA